CGSNAIEIGRLTSGGPATSSTVKPSGTLRVCAANLNVATFGEMAASAPAGDADEIAGAGVGAAAAVVMAGAGREHPATTQTPRTRTIVRDSHADAEGRD